MKMPSISLNPLLRPFSLALVLLLLLASPHLAAQTPAADAASDSLPIQEHMLLINELLFNPVGDDADYVELYNSSSSTLASDHFCLVRWVGDSLGKRHPLPPGYAIPPQSYVVLTTDTLSLLRRYPAAQPSCLLPMSTMPSYPNQSGTVLLYALDGTFQDRFDYHESMHNPLLHNKEGVALERSSLALDANEPGNWHSASAASGYGTPTRANSQCDRGWEALQLTLSSELFSPDGDGYQDQLLITCLTPLADLSLTLTIHDSQGRLVRHLVRNALCGTSDLYAWDGLDDLGTPCRRGTYVILADFVSSQGQHYRRRLAVALLR